MLSKRIEVSYYIVLIILLSVVMGVLCGMLFSDSEAKYIHLETLGEGRYEYIYTASQSTGCDDYLYGTGKISFATGELLERGIYADVLMLSGGTRYTGLTPFNCGMTLGERECALSENISVQHSLSIGDAVYSRHRVTGDVVEYTVKEILPTSYGVMDVDTSGSKGVIIVGYDEEFASLVRCEYIGFTDRSPGTVAKEAGVSLTGFESKSEIASDLVSWLVIAQILLALIAAAASSVAIIIHAHYQRVYYTRLALCGMPIAELGRTQLLDYLLPSLIANIIAALISSAIIFVRYGFIAFRTPLVCLAVGVIASFVCSAMLSRKIRGH